MQVVVGVLVRQPPRVRVGDDDVRVIGVEHTMAAETHSRARGAVREPVGRVEPVLLYPSKTRRGRINRRASWRLTGEGPAVINPPTT